MGTDQKLMKATTYSAILLITFARPKSSANTSRVRTSVTIKHVILTIKYANNGAKNSNCHHDVASSLIQHLRSMKTTNVRKCPLSTYVPSPETPYAFDTMRTNVVPRHNDQT